MSHHPTWSGGGAAVFCASLRDAGLAYADVADFCSARGWPRPSEVAPERRAKLLGLLAEGQEIRAAFDAWAADAWQQMIRGVANALAEMPTDAEADEAIAAAKAKAAAKKAKPAPRTRTPRANVRAS